MRIRGMGEKAQAAHIRAIRDFAAFLGHSRDTATPDELRAYQLHMTDTGVKPSTFNVRIVALRFFFGMTCGREEMKRFMQFQGQAAIKDFLRQYVGRGRYGNDYHHAFGRAFDPFYFRKDQPAYQPICAILAEYVGENFCLTHQEKVFGIKTRGLPSTTLRSLCTRHGIGLKITAQVLMAQHGIRAGASSEVDPSLIADLAPKLKDLINVQDAARHLGVNVDLLRGLMADGVLLPDYRFNDRMMGFRPKTLDAFLNQWSGPAQGRRTGGRTAKTPLTTVARANRSC